MSGSLQIKNGKFYIVLNIYQRDGKRKQKWISTDLPVKGNKRKAEKLLRQVLAEYENKINPNSSDVQFCDFIRSWLELVHRHIDEITFQGYEALSRVHILPYFEKLGLKLQEIDRATPHRKR